MNPIAGEDEDVDLHLHSSVFCISCKCMYCREKVCLLALNIIGEIVNINAIDKHSGNELHFKISFSFSCEASSLMEVHGSSSFATRTDSFYCL